MVHLTDLVVFVFFLFVKEINDSVRFAARFIDRLTDRFANRFEETYPSAYGKVPHVVAERGFHRWGFLRCGCVRKVFQHLLFYKNGFEHQQKVKPNRTKTRFLKKFDIRREPKGSQREPKGSQKGAKREPKIKKIIKFFSLSFFL